MSCLGTQPSLLRLLTHSGAETGVTQDAAVFDSAVDAVVELIYSSSAGGSPYAHQAALMPQLVQAVSSLPCESSWVCHLHSGMDGTLHSPRTQRVRQQSRAEQSGERCSALLLPLRGQGGTENKLYGLQQDMESVLPVRRDSRHHSALRLPLRGQRERNEVTRKVQQQMQGMPSCTVCTWDGWTQTLRMEQHASCAACLRASCARSHRCLTPEQGTLLGASLDQSFWGCTIVQHIF